MTVSGLQQSNADRHSVHRCDSQTRELGRGTEAELMTTARSLQNQELMTQGKDFSLQSCPSSETGWHGEERETKRVNMALAGYTLRLGKFNRFNKNGTFW